MEHTCSKPSECVDKAAMYPEAKPQKPPCCVTTVLFPKYCCIQYQLYYTVPLTLHARYLRVSFEFAGDSYSECKVGKNEATHAVHCRHIELSCQQTACCCCLLTLQLASSCSCLSQLDATASMHLAHCKNKAVVGIVLHGVHSQSRQYLISILAVLMV
eukprot:7986-Heterococcus_DN1.PRE.1